MTLEASRSEGCCFVGSLPLEGEMDMATKTVSDFRQRGVQRCLIRVKYRKINAREKNQERLLENNSTLSMNKAAPNPIRQAHHEGSEHSTREGVIGRYDVLILPHFLTDLD